MSRARIAVVALVMVGIAAVGACGFDGAGALGGDRLPDGALGSDTDGNTTVDIGDATTGSDSAVLGDAAPDGFVPPPPTCEAVCPAAGGTCVSGTCEITCSQGQPCGQLVVCPAGVPCIVRCGQDGCHAGIDCTKASSCDLTCGETACGDVKCGGGACAVHCNGDGNPACMGTVKCNATGACVVTCSSGGGCQGKVTCSGGSNFCP